MIVGTSEAPRERNTSQYGHEVEIPGGCRVVYRPDNKICGGARVWIESLYEVQVKRRLKDER